MKHIFLLHSIISIIPLYAYEPRGRMYDYHDIGLPQGNEVITGLIVAFIVIPLGFWILNAYKDVSSIGCFGMILIGVGIVALLPILAWLCSISGLVISIGFIVILVIALIYKLLK